MKVNPFLKPSWPAAYSFLLVTGALFLVSWYGQFFFQAKAFLVEQPDAPFGDYWTAFLASTLENWQSEFLQLVWQAAGLAIFYSWGSSQSRESDERIEAKVDALLRRHGVDPDTLR